MRLLALRASLGATPRGSFREFRTRPVSQPSAIASRLRAFSAPNAAVRLKRRPAGALQLLRCPPCRRSCWPVRLQRSINGAEASWVGQSIGEAFQPAAPNRATWSTHRSASAGGPLDEMPLPSNRKTSRFSFRCLASANASWLAPSIGRRRSTARRCGGRRCHRPNSPRASVQLALSHGGRVTPWPLHGPAVVSPPADEAFGMPRRRRMQLRKCFSLSSVFSDSR